MTALKLILLSLGVIAFLIALCVVVIALEKKYPANEYDERQQSARGRGYRFGFIVGIVCQFLGLVAVVLCVEEGQYSTQTLVLISYCCMLIPAAAFFTYCLIKDALVPLWSKAWLNALFFGLLAAAQFTRAFPRQDILPEAQPVWHCLVAGIFLAYLALLHILYQLRQRKA